MFTIDFNHSTCALSCAISSLIEFIPIIGSTLIHVSWGSDLTDIHRLAKISVRIFESSFSMKVCMA